MSEFQDLTRKFKQDNIGNLSVFLMIKLIQNE